MYIKFQVAIVFLNQNQSGSFLLFWPFAWLHGNGLSEGIVLPQPYMSFLPLGLFRC